MTLEERIEKLESSNRRSRWLIALMAFVIVGGATMGFTRDDVQKKIRVREIEFVNENGDIGGGIVAAKDKISFTLQPYGPYVGGLGMEVKGQSSSYYQSSSLGQARIMIGQTGATFTTWDGENKMLWMAPAP